MMLTVGTLHDNISHLKSIIIIIISFKLFIEGDLSSHTWKLTLKEDELPSAAAVKISKAFYGSYLVNKEALKFFVDPIQSSL